MTNPGQNDVDRRLYDIGRSWSDAHYTPETRLIGRGVRGATAYALFLAAGGDAADCHEVDLIIPAVVAQQQTDPNSPDFGLFKTSLDADGYTDKNWAAFCGSYLMHIPCTYADQVSDTSLGLIQEAILRACAFIKARDVTPGYTNIAMLSASVLTVGGELYGATEYVDEGRRKMRELADHINLTGSFQEYSSPTYYGTNMSALCWMGMFVQDEEIRDLALRMQARMWRSIGAHFHAPTGQLAGPHSRAYGNILQNYAAAVKYYIYKVLGDDFDLGENVEHGGDTTYAGLAALQDVACPDDAREEMLDAELSVEVRETVRTDGAPVDTGYTGPFWQMTTYQTEAFSLGTINRGEGWAQRRNLMLYWNDGTGHPAALTLRLWENEETVRGLDHTFWTVQDEHRTLVLYDPSKLETKTLQSLSLVLELEVDEIPELWIGGQEDRVLPRRFGNNREVFLRSGDVGIGIEFHASGFPFMPPRGEVRGVGDGIQLVFDLYRGEPREISGVDFGGAVCAFALEVVTVEDDEELETFMDAFVGCEIRHLEEEEIKSVRWRLEDTVLTLEESEHGHGNRYRGVIDGLAVVPSRLIEGPI